MSPFVLPFVPNARTKEIVSNTFIMFSNISRQKRIPLRTIDMKDTWKSPSGKNYTRETRTLGRADTRRTGDVALVN